MSKACLAQYFGEYQEYCRLTQALDICLAKHDVQDMFKGKNKKIGEYHLYTVGQSFV
jgi:hypothetical protein